jgi:hypothetical protein
MQTRALQLTSAPQPSAHYYREKAWEIRRFAWRASSTEARLELYEIAELFERMADRVERRTRPRRTRGFQIQMA